MNLNRRWDRTEQARAVRAQLWRYVSPASTSMHDVLPTAAALLQLPRTDRDYLTALHLLLSPQAAALVDAAPDLLRRLTTSTTVTMDEHPERIRGPVDWPSTLSMRGVRGTRIGYATRPTERIMSTPENRLLVAALEAVRRAHHQLSWAPTTKSPVGAEITALANRAGRLRSSPVLRTVNDPLHPRDLQRTARGRAARRFRPATDLWQLHHDLVDLQDEALLRRLVESTALVPATDGAMLELVTLFATLDTLQRDGWVSHGIRLVRGRVRVRHTKADGSTLTVHYQDTPGDLSKHDGYRQVLQRHQVPSNPLRPDLVLTHRPANGSPSLTVVEVKYRREASDAARAATLNAMAYRDAYSGNPQPTTYVGLFWGAGLRPRPDGNVWLCSFDHWPETLLLATMDRA